MGQIPFFFDGKKKSPPAAKPPEEPKIITVSELQRRLRADLEEHYATVYVGGEISNYKLQARSGHAYFTLKDERAQVACVMFRDAISRTKHRIQDGMEIIVRGRVTVYEGSGQLQINVQAVEPTGLGARQLEFQQRVEKLKKEGLTADARKRKIPAFPRCIGIVTSKEGAALRDVLRTIYRRDPYAHVLLSFAQVQGAGAAGDIARALRVIDEAKRCDVILLCRGGGSIEDLWCFNEEIVARAICVSSIPVVTGIGHETDTTIADLVADLRVSTPTAAAEHVTPVRSELRAALAQREARLTRALSLRAQTLGGRLARLQARLRDPRAMIERRGQRLDELSTRMERSLRQRLSKRRAQLAKVEQRLAQLAPAAQLAEQRARLDELAMRMERSLRQRLAHARAQLSKNEQRLARVDPTAWVRAEEQRVLALESRLAAAIARTLDRDRHRYEVAVRDIEARSPMAILTRGYALVFDQQGRLVKRKSAVNAGDRLSVRLGQGGLRVRVEEDD